MPRQLVAIVVCEGVQALDVAGPMDVFSEANAFLDSADRYETVLVAAHRNPLRAWNGLRLLADLTFDDAAGGFDIVLVAGTPQPPQAEPDPSLIGWVKELPWRSSIYGSICTGAFVLGYAGLLDERRVNRTQGRQAAGRGCSAPRRTVAVQSLSHSTCRSGIADRTHSGPCDG